MISEHFPVSSFQGLIRTISEFKRGLMKITSRVTFNSSSGVCVCTYIMNEGFRIFFPTQKMSCKYVSWRGECSFFPKCEQIALFHDDSWQQNGKFRQPTYKLWGIKFSLEKQYRGYQERAKGGNACRLLLWSVFPCLPLLSSIIGRFPASILDVQKILNAVEPCAVRSAYPLHLQLYGALCFLVQG